MKRPRSKATKTERINLCLRPRDRERLESIARREDRDLGYVCSWFVEWGMEQYLKNGLSLVDLRFAKMVRDKLREKRAEERLILREEAQRIDEEARGASPERKRA